MEKTSGSRVKNQQTQPTRDAKSGTWGPFLESPESLRAIFRVSQFPLDLKNGEDLSLQTLHLSFFLLP